MKTFKVVFKDVNHNEFQFQAEKVDTNISNEVLSFISSDDIVAIIPLENVLYIYTINEN